MKQFAFLRAVNVGGRNMLNMKELQRVLLDAGFENVRTYIQSGNIIFDAHENCSQVYISCRINMLILEHFGLDLDVIVRTAKDLQDIINNCPYPVQNAYITMLSDTATNDLQNSISTELESGDKCSFFGNNVYVFAQTFYHKTKFSNVFFEKKLKLNATSRSISTITKLIEEIVKWITPRMKL